MTVRDSDSGPNGLVTVTLQHHKQDFGLQQMFRGQYMLKIRQPLSLDRHAQYKIKIVAEDKGTPSQKNSYVLVVKLADSNRNAPKFAQGVYTLDIGDDVVPDRTIMWMRATDDDDGRNSELTYSLESMRIGERNATDAEMASWFFVDMMGQVVVLSKLWCAFTPSFTLNIDVRDNGRVPLHGKTVLKISVKCSQRMFNFSVQENEPKGTECGRIPLSFSAPDKPLRVRLLTNTTDFAFYGITGILLTARVLDRESNSTYLLTAVVTDGTVEMQITLNVSVLDVNDNSPVFVGIQGRHNITVTNAVFIGETVFKVQATDKDAGANGLVQYSIVNGNDHKVFHMNKRNGKITLRKVLTEARYVLTIRAADSGDIEKEAFLYLTIRVDFITPAPPPSGRPPRPATTKADNGLVETRTGDGGFFSDTKMIILVGACAGFLLLSVFLTAVFCMKCRRKDKNKKEEDKRGSYHEPDISREDALKASKKMFQQATANPREAAEVLLTTRKQPINVSPLPIKKMHPMTYQAPPGIGSPTGNSRPDMYFPLEPHEPQEMVEYRSSEDELDSGRGGSSRGSSPYCPHSPPYKNREDDWRPPNHVKYPVPEYRVRSPGMQPPPPPYEDVQRRKAYVTLAGVTHSTTDL